MQDSRSSAPDLVLRRPPLAMLLPQLLVVLLLAFIAPLATALPTVHGKEEFRVLGSESRVIGALPLPYGALLFREDDDPIVVTRTSAQNISLPGEPELAAFRTVGDKVFGAVVLRDDPTRALRLVGEWDLEEDANLPAGIESVTGVKRLVSSATHFAAITEDRTYFFSPRAVLPFDSLSLVRDIVTSRLAITVLQKNGTLLQWGYSGKVYSNHNFTFEQLLPVLAKPADDGFATVAADLFSRTILHISRFGQVFTAFEYSGGRVIKAVGREYGVAVLSETGEVTVMGFDVGEISLTEVKDISWCIEFDHLFALLREDGVALFSNGTILGQNISEIGPSYALSNTGEYIPFAAEYVADDNFHRQVEKVHSSFAFNGLQYADNELFWVKSVGQLFSYVYKRKTVAIDYSTILPNHMDEIREILTFDTVLSGSYGGATMIIITHQGDAVIVNPDSTFLILAGTDMCLETVDYDLDGASFTPRHGGFQILNSASTLAFFGSLESGMYALPPSIDQVWDVDSSAEGFFVTTSSGSKAYAWSDLPDACTVLNDPSLGELSGFAFSDGVCVGLINNTLVLFEEGVRKDAPRGEFTALISNGEFSSAFFAIRSDGAVFNRELWEVHDGLVDSELHSASVIDNHLSLFFKNGTVYLVGEFVSWKLIGEGFTEVSCSDFEPLCSGITEDGEIVLWRTRDFPPVRLPKNNTLEVGGIKYFYSIVTADGIGRLLNIDGSLVDEVEGVAHISSSSEGAVAVTKEGKVKLFPIASNSFSAEERAFLKSLEGVRSVHVSHNGRFVVLHENGVARRFLPEHKNSMLHVTEWQGVRNVVATDDRFFLEFEDGSGISFGEVGGFSCILRPATQPTKSDALHRGAAGCMTKVAALAGLLLWLQLASSS